MSSYKLIPVWISGFFVAIGLMVFDEVLTLARYCGPDCTYPIPFIGDFSQYGAEIFGWLLIIAAFSILLVPVTLQQSHAQKPEGYRGNIRRIIPGHTGAVVDDKRPEIPRAADRETEERSKYDESKPGPTVLNK